jgi:hypothetical protein
MSLLNKLFHFVLIATKKYNIDESHGISHSMNVLRFAKEIYDEELANFPIIKQHEQIIYVSAVLHDMCDKKYMKQEDGIREIELFLCDKMTATDINVIKLSILGAVFDNIIRKIFPIIKSIKYLIFRIVSRASSGQFLLGQTVYI